ncbi:putative Lipopolysaccharide 1, 3-galactosyltransferase [Xenorhabdus poinarii G6]|uniref:Putative Lipopolysaccharide 1, 3-galactosyltransferase n=1 Tax=Xenorhabdus poinarii G6 TaxID=1354304 RepID=A0A068R0L8_9GAMM|nr:glycosyltransferase [Xenorhabdus poinarii]CDG20466.1 putative Lipopolysaccharide 1, 3-galactosyltransferase [Xenorhabdus poinarii G6]
MQFDTIVHDVINIGSSNKEEPMLHIAFGVDEKFLRPAGVVISSILKTNSNKKLKFHIFINEISDDSIERLKNIDANITIHIFNDSRFKGLQEKENLPISMYYRIIVPYILHSVTDKVLYLDADLLCVGKLDELMNHKFKNNEISCVVNHKSLDVDNVNYIGIKDKTHYFNSGVMLINTIAWVENDIFKEFSTLIKIRDFKYPDQDVLNIILEGKVKYLNQIYNNFMEDVNVGDETVFIHFTGTPKPWQLWYEKSDIYDVFYSDSPWHDVPYDIPRTARQMRIYAKKLSKQGKLLSGYIWKLKYLIYKITEK